MEVSPRHAIERVRREPKRRRVTVAAVQDLTPRMRRVLFTSPQLADFSSLGADDHVKLFAPDPASPEAMVGRDYTPRAFDSAKGELSIDFALHEAGPATVWALGAKIGDELQIGGPRGSMVVADDFDFYVLIGDETALPAIGRRVEALRPKVPVFTFVVLDDFCEVQNFETRTDWRPVWVYRNGDSDAELLRAALRSWTAQQGDGYVWIAAEAKTARALKDYMLNDRGHPKGWLKASGYWVAGKAGVSEKFED